SRRRSSVRGASFNEAAADRGGTQREVLGRDLDHLASTRPPLIAAEHRSIRIASFSARPSFNEAAADRGGTRVNACSAPKSASSASTRPPLIAAEHLRGTVRPGPRRRRFNEAAADRGGTRCRAARSACPRAPGFNEAAADRGGTRRPPRRRRGSVLGFNE